MKKHILLFLGILIFASCDKLEGPFMTDSNISPIDTSSNSFIKKVLIEDYTGHTCPNCPDAARELEAIHDIYGDQIIGMAVHVSKTFARPYHISQAPEFQYDFRTQWGDDWDNFFEISSAGLPRGMINRIGVADQTHKLGKDEWAAAVANELLKETIFKISIITDTTLITTTTNVAIDTIDNFNLVICLTENNIINWQKDGQLNVEDYEHNHVLRSVVLDEPLSSSSTYNQGVEIEKSVNIDLNALEQFNIDYSANNTAELGNGNAGGWEKDNMHVIAYIYNTNTYEIVQVEEVNLITP